MIARVFISFLATMFSQLFGFSLALFTAGLWHFYHPNNGYAGALVIVLALGVLGVFLCRSTIKTFPDQSVRHSLNTMGLLWVASLTVVAVCVIFLIGANINPMNISISWFFISWITHTVLMTVLSKKAFNPTLTTVTT